MTSVADSTSLTCSICNQALNNPHLLPCLHVFCLPCLRNECSEKSRDKFFCPLCVVDKDNRRSVQARPWHSFEKIVENEAAHEALQRRLAELPASEIRRESVTPDYDDDDVSSDLDNGSRRPSLPQPPVVFPCSMHVDNLADKFCTKCEQLACDRCVASFHKRCKNLVGIQEAVDSKKDALDNVYSIIASNLVQCQKVQEDQARKLAEIEAMRIKLLLDIKTTRTQLVNTILAKEKLLTDEANRMIDSIKQGAADRELDARNLARACNRQLDVLNFSFSVKSEGELLPLLPTLACHVEADRKRMEGQREDREVTGVTFIKDEQCIQTLQSSPMGTLRAEKQAEEAPAPAREGQVDLSLTLMTSFHGGTRDDVVDPLLTDIVLLVNGDVITTDRDNKCVKKFNPYGKLLTRVLIEAVPSRVVVVSHSKAAVSVMNKKVIYFLSLFGTVRILNSVRVRKFYSFLASLGGGVMVAATNQCDCIDILTEKGETIRNIFSQKADRAAIARPMYLTPAVAYSSINEGPRTSPPTGDAVKPGSPSTTGQYDVIVSDSGKKILFRLGQSGHVAFTLKSSSSVPLECPLGVTVHESGFTLLADRDTNSIVLLDDSGKVMRKILTADQGLVKPCGIYAGHKGQVALTQVDGMVKIYTSHVVPV